MANEEPLENAELVTLDILALPESTASVLYSLFDVFSSVGGMWSFLTGEKQNAGGFKVRIVAPQSDIFLCHGGIPVSPHAGFDDCRGSQVIVIPDLVLEPDFCPDDNWRQTKVWLQRQYAMGSVICSVCTGSFLLADSGLLDGKEATTHWSAAEMIRSRFPEVTLHEDKIFVPADEEHRIITAGGMSSWIELSLYLIKRYFGYQEATRAAKIFLLGDRSNGQLPFASMSRPKDHQDAVIEECQIWIAQHYEEQKPVGKMIERSGLTKRTFMRRFIRATGFKPVDYVQCLRIEEAKQLLETTQTAIEEVSAEVGYEDPSYFRRLFKKKAGVSPAKYRTMYQAIRYLGETGSHCS
jgi:transcriptional regulator GlxA family with amidase domain